MREYGVLVIMPAQFLFQVGIFLRQILHLLLQRLEPLLDGKISRAPRARQQDRKQEVKEGVFH